MKKGNSLIDVVVAIAVVMIIGTAILFSHDVYTKLLIRRSLMKESNFIIESVCKELKYNYTKTTIIEKFNPPCENIYLNTSLNFDSLKSSPLDTMPKKGVADPNLDNVTKLMITSDNNEVHITLKTVLSKNGVKYEKEITFKKI